MFTEIEAITIFIVPILVSQWKPIRNFPTFILLLFNLSIGILSNALERLQWDKLLEILVNFVWFVEIWHSIFVSLRFNGSNGADDIHIRISLWLDKQDLRLLTRIDQETLIYT